MDDALCFLLLDCTYQASEILTYSQHISIKIFSISKINTGDISISLLVGDSVVVKSGVLDPDLGIDISGWQGRIGAFDGDTIFIRWDSITLQEMGLDLIESFKHCVG